jgi:radical SAM protein (TIGR04043 family)
MNYLHVELQSLGVRTPPDLPRRRGGAGPAEGVVIILNGRFLNVPTESSYVASSPFEIKSSNGSLFLFRDGTVIEKVYLPRRPCFYGLKTPDGIFFDKLALVHGKDCFATTVYQDCLYWQSKDTCAFCGIGISLRNHHTVLEKHPEALALVAKHAKLLDNVTHATLTTGIRISERETVCHLARCIAAIKKETNLPIHVQICPPSNMNYIEWLKNAGADTVGIHIESFDRTALKRFAPSKAAFGFDSFISAWKHAVSVFGMNQVSSFIIAGLEEDEKSIIEGAELLCELGVFPYVLPLRPVPGTPLESARPPDPDAMVRVYQQTGVLLKKYGLSTDAFKAGCVKCGACSSICLFA